MRDGKGAEVDAEAREDDEGAASGLLRRPNDALPWEGTGVRGSGRPEGDGAEGTRAADGNDGGLLVSTEGRKGLGDSRLEPGAAGVAAVAAAAAADGAKGGRRREECGRRPSDADDTGMPSTSFAASFATGAAEASAASLALRFFR